MIPNRVVIDTNVCLDLFVFRDPRWDLLHSALKSGEIEAVTRADCKMEWQIVLGYKHLPLDLESRADSAAQFDALIAFIEPEPRSHLLLPKCSDSDDQKFLELARDAEASILITKDKALLKLARRIGKLGLFSIIVPEKWAHPAAL
ncbi:MAG: putative toxin-antitoxin system toxin component, PIN family [Pseudomonadota bacterium]